MIPTIPQWFLFLKEFRTNFSNVKYNFLSNEKGKTKAFLFWRPAVGLNSCRRGSFQGYS